MRIEKIIMKPNICFYMKKSYIFRQKTEFQQRRSTYGLCHHGFGQVLFDVNHDQVNFLKDVLL